MLIYSIFTMIQGFFHIHVVPIGEFIAIIYSSYAISDFFGKNNIRSLLKSFICYIFGIIFFLAVLTILKIMIDWIF